MVTVPSREDLLHRWVSITDKITRIPDLVLSSGAAYAGFSALKHPMGAVYGLLGLRLAQTDGLFSNAAGLAILAHIGLSNLAPNTAESPLTEIQRIDPQDPKIPAIPVPGPGGAGMAGVVPIQETWTEEYRIDNPYLAGQDLMAGRYFPF